MEYSAVTKSAVAQVEYKTVATEKVISDNKPKTVNLTPPEPGSYRLRANFANAEDDITATDIQVWATGAGRVYWGSQKKERLKINSIKTPIK